MFDEISVPIDDARWDALISAWIAFAESDKRPSDHDATGWAESAVSDWRYDEKHEAVWEFIIRSFEREMSDRALAFLASGAVEDLLADFGEIYIDRIEELARKNPRFNYLLGGVWKNGMTDDVWTRVQKARLAVW